MDKQKAIIDKIIEDAETRAAEIISVATAEAEKSIADGKSWAESYKNEQGRILKAANEDKILRRKTVAELDVKKIVLKAKQDSIESVFDSAYNKLCALKKTDYLSFVVKLIEKYAEEKDTVVLSSDGVISETDLTSLEVVKDKKLTVSDVKGEFVGGIMLVGEICDKDLTFKSLVNEYKPEFVSDVSKELFGN